MTGWPRLFPAGADSLFLRLAVVIIVTVTLAQIVNVVVLVGQQRLTFANGQAEEAFSQFADHITEARSGADAPEPVVRRTGTQLYLITDHRLSDEYAVFVTPDVRLSERFESSLEQRGFVTAAASASVEISEGRLRDIFTGGLFAEFGIPVIQNLDDPSTAAPAMPYQDQIRFRALLMEAQIEDGLWLNSIHFTRPPEVGIGWRIVIATLALLSFSLIILLYAVAQIARPFDDLARASDRVRRGEMSEPLPEEGPADVRRTIAAFNALNASRDQLIQTQDRMIGAVGHDLRTPLTVLRLCAEKTEDPENRQKMIETIEDMQAMLSSILDYARQSGAPEDLRSVDLTALVDTVCADYAEMGRPVVFEGEPRGVTTRLRAAQMKRAIQNLANNALKYGGDARVSVIAADPIIIRVDDTGPGVPEALLEDIREPFRRGEASRNRETGGSGLGLPIVEAIAEAHGGQLVLENRPGGFRAEIHLPQA